MFRTSWFEVQQPDSGVHLISEPGHVNSFLIQGAKSAILFDTGLGVANIRKVAEELSDHPLVVVNSHYHFDHTGGNRLFDEIAIHRIGAALLEQPAPPGLAEGYMEYTQHMLQAWGPYKEADDIYFHLLTAERMIRPSGCVSEISSQDIWWPGGLLFPPLASQAKFWELLQEEHLLINRVIAQKSAT